jgi:superfamily II DNA or RNA helicase
MGLNNMNGALNRPAPLGVVMAKPTLYRWQGEAIDACKVAIQDDEGAAVAGATGTGKSRVALELMDWYRFERGGGLFTIVVPTKALMIQWRDGLIEYGFDADCIGRCGGGSIKGWKNTVSDTINITTIQSLQRGKLVLPDALDKHMVVVDECHNLRGAKARHCLDGVEYDAIIGLSATPHPTDEARDIVENVIGKIVYSYRYAQALADGVIPPFALNLVRVKMNRDESGEVDVLTNKIKSCMREAQYNSREETNRLHAIARNLGTQRKRVLNRCRSRFHMALRVMAHHGNVPTLLFHESTEDVDKLSQMTPHNNAAVYHSNHPSKDAELERFKDKETNHLYSCLSLTEGFNVPFVEVAIMMSGPNAPLRRIQTLGRSLRGNKEHINQVYFFYVNHKKDLEGVHNLIEQADIPPEVIHHYEMEDVSGDVPVGWMKELQPLQRREAWIPIAYAGGGERPVCDKCGRDFRGQVGLNNHHCVPRRDPDAPRRTFEDMFGPTPDTFDEFMDGFN